MFIIYLSMVKKTVYKLYDVLKQYLFPDTLKIIFKIIEIDLQLWIERFFLF